MHMVTVATLVHAVSSCTVARYTALAEPGHPIVKEFPDELTGLVMGLILHDIGRRTELRPVSSIQYIPIENLDVEELRKALLIIRDKSARSHYRRFVLLLKILQKFNRPPTFH
jgi:hypothetical protein